MSASEQVGERTSRRANKSASEQVGERTSRRANKSASEQVGERTSRRANKSASEQVGERTSRRANKSASEQVGERTSRRAPTPEQGGLPVVPQWPALPEGPGSARIPPRQITSLFLASLPLAARPCPGLACEPICPEAWCVAAVRDPGSTWANRRLFTSPTAGTSARQACNTPRPHAPTCMHAAPLLSRGCLARRPWPHVVLVYAYVDNSDESERPLTDRACRRQPGNSGIS
jgi:hypothetical protein